MATTAVPTWPGLAGWFGTLLALLWLVEPKSFQRPLLAVTALLLVCWGYGVYRQLNTSDLPTPWRRAVD